MLTKENYFLAVVGIGIKFLSHLTHEARVHIEQAAKVLYLLNTDVAKEWVCQLNDTSESLDSIYKRCDNRQESYDAITEYILETLQEYKNVCVVLYGHPCVFASPALNAVRRAREDGFQAELMPAISAEDCLFADLLIDPGTIGCQSFEATDFLVYQRKFDPSSHLILWQVGVIGALGLTHQYENKASIKNLTAYLLKSYPADHNVIVYEAAQLPGFAPNIKEVLLADLETVKLAAIHTLYVPPAVIRQYSISSYKQLFETEQ